MADEDETEGFFEELLFRLSQLLFQLNFPQPSSLKCFLGLFQINV